MRSKRRLVTLLSVVALLLVNIVAIGLLSSSAYEVKSGQQTTDESKGQVAAPAGAAPQAPAPCEEAPVAAVTSAPKADSGKSSAAPQASCEEVREEAGFKGFAVIDGYKFDDLNGNGVQDAGEPGLAGVTITCTWMGIEHVSVSDANGYFRFPWCIAATWSVKEHGLDGYYNTTPTSLQVTVTWWEHKSVNFGNTRYAGINGVKFDDLNKNGVQDAGEPGIPGVTIWLEGEGLYTNTVTDGGGLFGFSGLKAGSYNVSEDLSTCPGYFPTTPTYFDLTLAPGDNKSVSFGNAKEEEEEYGAIEGYKFLDLNANGVMDAGESGMPGVTVQLTGNGIDPVQAVTDSNGHFRFDNLKPGDYQVELLNDPPAYYLTTPGKYDVGLSPLETETVFFGNAFYGKITGYKYEDLNGNGSRDAGEPPLEDVVINLLVGGEIVATTGTNGSGYFEFPSLKAGGYAVQEIVPEGFFNTSPVEVIVSLEPGETEGVEFLNARHGKISGHKWNDLDGNGVLDQGEQGLGGVVINLVNLGGGYAASTVTDSDGYYEFTGLTPGAYRVSEVVPAGFRPTSPEAIEVTLSSGDSREVDFLNTSDTGELGSISGTKWEDGNGNGEVDEGELGLANVTIQLWAGVELQAEQVTGADGGYLFENLPAGDYIVMEVVPQDYYPTSTTSIPVSLADGEDRGGVDFLNAPYASITGNKWDDPDQDGVHTDDEAPVPGVTITLSRAGYADVQVVTDSNGAFSFADLEAGTYTVTETLPSGSQNTTPLSVTLTLEPGDEAFVYFLNATVGGEIIEPPVTPSATTPGGGQLPLTGMNQAAYYTAAVLLMLLGMLAVLLGLARRRRPAPFGGVPTTPVSDKCRFDDWV